MEHSAFEDQIFSEFSGPLSPLDGKSLTPTSSVMTTSHGMHSVMLSLPPGATVMQHINSGDLCSQRLPDCQTLLSAGSPKMDPYKSSTPDYDQKMEYVTKMGCYSPTQKYEYLTAAPNGATSHKMDHHQYSPPPSSHQNPANGLSHHHKPLAHHHHHHAHSHQQQHQQHHHSPSAMLNDYHHQLHNSNGKMEYDPHGQHQHHQQQHHIYATGSPHHNHHSHEIINSNNGNEHNMSPLHTNGLITSSAASSLAVNSNSDGGLLQPPMGVGMGGGPSPTTANSNTNGLTASSASVNGHNQSPTGLTNSLKLNKGKHDEMCSPPNPDGGINGNTVGNSSVSNTNNTNNNTPPAVKKNDKKKGDPNGIKKKKTRYVVFYVIVSISYEL